MLESTLSLGREQWHVREVNVAVALRRALAPDDMKGDLEQREDLPELEILGKTMGHVGRQ